jgi:hypothetical protein
MATREKLRRLREYLDTPPGEKYVPLDERERLPGEGILSYKLGRSLDRRAKQAKSR